MTTKQAAQNQLRARAEVLRAKGVVEPYVAAMKELPELALLAAGQDREACRTLEQSVDALLTQGLLECKVLRPLRPYLLKIAAEQGLSHAEQLVAAIEPTHPAVASAALIAKVSEHAETTKTSRSAAWEPVIRANPELAEIANKLQVTSR